MRAPIALAVIGGMLVSTFLMLVVVPTLYDIFDKIGHRVGKRTETLLHGDHAERALSSKR